MSIRSLLASGEHRDRKKKARRQGAPDIAQWTAKHDGEGQYIDSPARQPSREKDARYLNAVAEAAPALECITDAASKGAQAVLEACLDYDEGGKEDQSLVADAVETYSSLVMSEVQTRLKALQDSWISQKVAKKKSIDDKVLSLMAEIRDGRERERDNAERTRSELRATKSQQVQEDLECQRVAFKKGVRAEIATQFADLGGFPLLRGEAKSALEQRREDRQAALAALRVELEKKLENQKEQEKRELKNETAKVVEFRDNHGDVQVRRMLKLNSQIAIATAHIAELKRKLEEQRARNAEKERMSADECGQRIATMMENLRLDTVRAEEWRAKQVKDLENVKGERIIAKETGFLLRQLQDSSLRAMATISGGIAPRIRSRKFPSREQTRNESFTSTAAGSSLDTTSSVSISNTGGENNAEDDGDGSEGTGGLTEEDLRGHFEARERRRCREQDLTLANTDLVGETSMVAADKLLKVSDESGSDMVNVSLRQAAIDQHRPAGKLDAPAGGKRDAANVGGRGTYGAGPATVTVVDRTSGGDRRNIEEAADCNKRDFDVHDAQSTDAIRKAATAAAKAAEAVNKAIVNCDAVAASGLSAELLERQVASLLAAGPPPSTPEDALRLLAAAGWESSADAAMQQILNEKSERIDSETQRQELAERWAVHNGRESIKPNCSLKREDIRNEKRFSAISDTSGTSQTGSADRRSQRGQRKRRDGLSKRTVSSREYGDGVQLIPVVRVESSPELHSTRADRSPPRLSPQPAAHKSTRGRRQGMTVGTSCRTTSLMPIPHLAPSPNHNGTAGSRHGSRAGSGVGVSTPAVIYDPFITDSDHTELGKLLLNLSGASNVDPRWAPPGGGGRLRRRGKMRGESRLGAAPPRGAGAWVDLAPSPGAKTIAAAREMSL